MALSTETLLRMRRMLVERREEVVKPIDADIAAIDAEINATTGSPSVTSQRAASSARPRQAGRSRGQDAVALVLREAGPGNTVLDGDLFGRMRDHGVEPKTTLDERAQLNAARAAANRLVQRDPERFERVKGPGGNGYRYLGEPHERERSDAQVVEINSTTASGEESDEAVM